METLKKNCKKMLLVARSTLSIRAEDFSLMCIVTGTRNLCLALVGLAGLSPQQDVDLLLDPVLVVGRVRVGGLLVDQARQVRQLKGEGVLTSLKTKPKNLKFNTFFRRKAKLIVFG